MIGQTATATATAIVTDIMEKTLPEGHAQDTYFPQDTKQEHKSEPPLTRIKRKRNRVPVACFACRSLKTKCDGAKPVCTTCTASGETCQYSSQGITPSVASATINQEYLNSLERRLAQIERKTVNEDDASSHSGTLVLPRSPSVQILSSARSESLIVSADPDVLMGGVNFTQLILNAMNTRTVGVHAHSPNLTRDESFPVTQSELFHIPSNAREMLGIFLGRRHQLSPIFHVPTIVTLFDAALDSELSARGPYRYTLAIMNMAFAICSSHQLLDTHIAPAQARRYYDIGIELLQPTLLQDWNLEKVQALLLGARYLQSSNCPDECWNVLGIAIRIAYGLELHKPPPDTDGYNIQETKKRVWNACFTLDKLLSMVYARPPATSTSACSCPLPEDLEDNCIFKERIMHPSPPRTSGMAFSIEVAKLYRIMESATDLSNLDLVGGEILAQSVVALDERYQKWYNALPPQLILDPNEVYEKPLILGLRANMVRMLIHRQSLALTLRGITETRNKRLNDNIKSGMLRHSRQICVKAAMDTIDIVGLRHEESHNATGPSWFNLYYLFNSILVLVSHVLDPSYHDDKLSLSSLDAALNMIKSMSSNHAFAQRAHTFLNEVLAFMDKSIQKPATPPHPPTNWAAPTPSTATHPMAKPPPVNHEIYQQIRSATLMPMNGTQTLDTGGSPDLYALFDYTHDLTQNLGSHLDNFEAVGPRAGMWSWQGDEFGGPQAGV